MRARLFEYIVASQPSLALVFVLTFCPLRTQGRVHETHGKELYPGDVGGNHIVAETDDDGSEWVKRWLH